jgi:hypothetical protein
LFSQTGVGLPDDALASLTDILIASKSAKGMQPAAPTLGETGWDQLDQQMPMAVAPPTVEQALLTPEVEGESIHDQGTPRAKRASKRGPRVARDRSTYIEWAVLAVVGVTLAALALFGLICFSTALYLVAMMAVAYVLWIERSTSTVYTVILGCALTAVLTSVYVLWIELGRYQFDIKARRAKAPLSLVIPVHSGPVNTTAAACPNDVRLTSSAKESA